MLKLAADYWGSQAFGEWIVARRTIGLIQLPLMCGMGIALTRYLAFHVTAKQEQANAYLIAGIVTVLVPTSLAAIAMNFLAPQVATLVFDAPRYAREVRAMAVAVLGLAAHAVAYSAYRGELRMAQANALQAWNLGLAPLLVFAIPGRGVAELVLAMGVIWLCVAGAALGRELWRRRPLTSGSSDVKRAGREMLSYGLSRVPGDFAYVALFSFPVIIAAHRSGIEVAGFVGLALSLLTMIGSAFAPLGQILLPSVSAAAGNSATRFLRHDIRRLALVCTLLTVLPVVALTVWMPEILVRTLGPAFLPATLGLRLVSLAAIPYVAYIVLRQVNDALDPWPRNTVNLIIALAIFLLMAFLGDPRTAIPLGVATAAAVLGVSSVLSTRAVFNRLAAKQPG